MARWFWGSRFVLLKWKVIIFRFRNILKIVCFCRSVSERVKSIYFRLGVKSLEPLLVRRAFKRLNAASRVFLNEKRPAHSLSFVRENFISEFFIYLSILTTKLEKNELVASAKRTNERRNEEKKIMNWLVWCMTQRVLECVWDEMDFSRK